MNLPKLTLLSLATYRATRAITQDEIFRPLQDVVHNPVYPIPEKIRYLLSCPHCLPPYIALTIVIAEHYVPRTTRTLTTVLAAAAISTLITDYTDAQEKKNLPSFPSASSAAPATSTGTPPPLI